MDKKITSSGKILQSNGDDKRHTPRQPYLFFGASVHRVLELIHKDLIDGKLIDEEEIEKYVERAWIPSPRIEEDEEEYSRKKLLLNG